MKKIHKYLYINIIFYMSKVSTLVDCSDPEAVECLNDFVESIQLEMSVGGMIPFTITRPTDVSTIRSIRFPFSSRSFTTTLT